jgi:hypothetical protein
MVSVLKCLVGAAATWAVLALAPLAWGQASFGQRPIYGQMPFPINPNPQIAPGVSLQQYSFNVRVLGNAYRNIPPYLLGYNPYVRYAVYGSPYGAGVFQPAVYNPSPPVYSMGTPYQGGSTGGYMPYYGGNAYTGGYSGGGVDALTGQSTGAGNSGYGIGDYAQQAQLAKLDTRKKLVDAHAYVRAANEQQFTKQQIDQATRLLERVQKVPTSQEIASGKSLNILLDDLKKLDGLQVRGTAVMLEEDVLKLINVTSQGDGVNIGLLRDNGRFEWPAVFSNKNIVGDKEKGDIELRAQDLYREALNAKIDKNAASDLKASLRSLRESLNKNFKEAPAQNSLEGLRFLDNFDAAVVALEKGDAAVSVDFQQKFAKGGKTVQELVDYMKNKRLRFAPANPSDEPVYQALQTALAAQSMMVHNQISAAAKE